jgi:hypothetical protein
MRVPPKLRIGLVVGALALTLVAVRWAGTLTDVPEASAGGVAEPVKRARPATESGTAAHSAPALDLQKLQRPRGLEPDGDPLGPRSFRPPPPKITPQQAAAQAALAAPPPPPPPQAPPLPFTYMGRLSEERDTTVFLALGDRNLVVKPGDTIDNTYKLEEVGDSAIVLTYLPMNQRQSLPIGTP